MPPAHRFELESSLLIDFEVACEIVLFKAFKIALKFEEMYLCSGLLERKYFLVGTRRQRIGRCRPCRESEQFILRRDAGPVTS